MIEKIRIEEIRAKAGVANINENIRDARLRWLGHVERNNNNNNFIYTLESEVKLRSVLLTIICCDTMNE